MAAGLFPDRFSMLIESHYPNILLLKGIDRLRQVGPRHAQMLARARRGIDHRRRNLHRMRQGDHHTVHTDYLCRAQERTKVLRVIQRIKKKNKRRLIPGAGLFQDLDQVAIGIGAHFGRYTLMVLVHLVQLAALDALDQDAALSGKIQDLLEPPFLLRALRYLDAEYIPALGA